MKRFVAMAIIKTAVTGSFFHPTSRPGFFVSFGFLAVIGSITLLMRPHWRHMNKKPDRPKPKIIGMSFRSPEQKTDRFKTKMRAEPD